MFAGHTVCLDKYRRTSNYWIVLGEKTSAPVDTRFFAQNDSIIRGPTVFIETYCMACKHSSACYYSELRIVAMQCPMLDPREELQSPCSCQHRDITFLHAVVLYLASKSWWKTWLLECSAVIQYLHKSRDGGAWPWWNYAGRPVKFISKLNTFIFGYSISAYLSFTN